MSVKNRNTIVTDGLSFYMDAGNSKSYPGSGSTCTDLINDIEGTLVSNAVYNSANGGNFVFDGADDAVDFNDVGTYTSATFCCWIKRDGTQNDWAGLALSRGNGGGTGGIGIRSSSKIFYIWDGNYWGHDSALTIEDGVWTMVTVTLGSGAVKFYKNTTSETLSTGTDDVYGDESQNLLNLRVGMDPHSGPRVFTGNIACASIYNRALSTTEIQQNYNALKNRFI